MSKTEQERLNRLKESNKRLREEILGTSESRNGTAKKKVTYNFRPIFRDDSVLKKATG